MPTQTDQFGEFMQSNYKSPIKKKLTKDELEQLNKVLPKKPKTYLEALQNSENPYSSEYYKKVTEKKDGSLIPNLGTITSILNYKNWGVTDYSHIGNFGDSYNAARKSGEKEFMWNNQRYSTLRENKNPNMLDSYESKFIPTTYLKNMIGSNVDNIGSDKKLINLEEGKLRFARTGEVVEGNTIIGGDFIENEPTAYPAYEYKTNIKDRFDSRGSKVPIDNTSQMYYGIIKNKLKTGLVSDFMDDDIITPIRYGGKYDKTGELSKEDSEFLRFFEENLMWDKIYNSEEFKKFINSHDRPFID